CQLCHKHGEGVKLVVHHIVYRSQGGTNRVDNLITLCTDCHTTKNHQPGGKLYKWMKAKKKVTKQLKGATFMNILRKRIMTAFPEASFQYGSQTYVDRKNLLLPKGHFMDAIAISGIKSVGQMPDTVTLISQFRKKKRSLHEATARKGRKQPNTSSKRNEKNMNHARGLWLNDYVRVIGNHAKGYVKGFKSKGYYVYLTDGLGNYVLSNGKNYINRKQCRLITHNGNWQKAEQKLSLYEFK
ncbi:HNH endonuclease, partial [Lactobacillus delbrueckii]|uniref:HNH endonuclease n=1 Tax=Lactobacillus delbrueckii TaxID=1584 RepID=UPI001F59241C